MAPELLPETNVGSIPLSPSALSTPAWASPRLPPPERTIPTPLAPIPLPSAALRLRIPPR